MTPLQRLSRQTAARLSAFHGSWKVLNLSYRFTQPQQTDNSKPQAYGITDYLNWINISFVTDTCAQESGFTKTCQWRHTRQCAIGHFTPCNSVLWKIHPRRLEAPPMVWRPEAAASPSLVALANSAIHPSGVCKWVVIHVIRCMDYGVKTKWMTGAWLTGA